MAEVKSEPKLVSENVLVACKLPHGLNLDLYDGKVLRSRVKLSGIMAFRIPNPDRKFVNPEVYAGHTITSVPRAHWEEWHEKHKSHPSVVNGFIYVSKTRDDAQAQAKEREKEQTGFEQLDPTKQSVRQLDNDPRPIEAR
jgi:hypothetical protein